MSEFKQHVLVCDVVRDDGRRCGNKGGGSVKNKFVEVLAARDLSSDVYVSSVGCTSQHGLCEIEQASIIIYGKNNQGTALSSGVYLMTIQFAENYTKQKITLLK